MQNDNIKQFLEIYIEALQPYKEMQQAIQNSLKVGLSEIEPILKFSKEQFSNMIEIHNKESLQMLKSIGSAKEAHKALLQSFSSSLPKAEDMIPSIKAMQSAVKALSSLDSESEVSEDLTNEVCNFLEKTNIADVPIEIKDAEKKRLTISEIIAILSFILIALQFAYDIYQNSRQTQQMENNSYDIDVNIYILTISLK